MAYCRESTSGAVQGVVSVKRFATNALGEQPLYLSASASLNAPLWMAKPWCCSGGAVSQREALFSLASFFACCNGSGNLSWTLAAAWSSYFHFVCIISLLAWCCGIVLWARSVCLCMISEISGDDRCRDVWYSLSAVVAGLMMPIDCHSWWVVPGALSVCHLELVCL